MKVALHIVLQSVDIMRSTDLQGVAIGTICSDSRLAEPNTLFIALKGTQSDGHQYITQVANKGCTAIVVEEWQPSFIGTQILVKDAHLALSHIAENFHGNPSKQLKLVGITGTNGKTTTTTLLHSLFTKMGYACGLLSTVVNKINTQEIPATHTTPDPISLSKLLADMIAAGCTHAFMEVSSHAIHQKRTAALAFDVALFSNITHDHLDYHNTFAEYIAVKKTLFDQLPKTAHAITNIDDKNGRVMVQNTKAKVYSYALKSPADFKAKINENLISGLVLQLDGIEVYTQLIGQFNAYNLLAIYAVSQVLEEDKLEVIRVISELESVEGRFQQYKSANGVTCIVDYAHTPDALENVLSTIASFHDAKHIVTVIGCGGDRDKTKRPTMAKIAAKYSAQAILTSDNPRTEDPEQILRDMEAGLSTDQLAKVLTIADRKSAIKTAIRFSKPGTVLLIAGKGHEKYQDINGIKHSFDDLSIAKEIFNQTSI